jgi:LEA14-like dessication related protein
MRFVFVALLAVLAGCSLFTRSIEKPSAKVRDVSLSSAGFSGVSGELSLDVMNPNPVGVPLSGIEWELSIAGTRTMTGSVELTKTIPARGVAPVTTMLKLAATDALAAGSALASGARDYKVRAVLRFATPIGPIEVEVEHAGMLGAGGIVGAI